MVEHLVEFLYMGEIRMDVYNEAKLCEIFDNLHKILGYEPDMRRDCEEGSSSEYDSVNLSLIKLTKQFSIPNIKHFDKVFLMRVRFFNKILQNLM